ncbi:MAG: 50S ribosomal protein L13 [Candidatus Paceibacterota bacterium]
MKYTIDATGKKLGRVASEAATLLMGKNSPEYARNKAPEVTVAITNAGKLSLAIKKLEQTKYSSYSGYPGGLTFKSMEQIIEKKGISEVLKMATKGMLPSNKLRPIMMKNLIITE